MRLAVISDIHGNLDGLLAVLADVRAAGAERLYVNGDVVNRGPDSVACMEAVLSAGVSGFTLGNHDDLMLLWSGRSVTLPPDWFSDAFWGATEWSVGQLAAAGLLAPIGAWPMTLRLSEPGLPDVVLAHGSPQHYREAVGPFTPEEHARELLTGAGAGVLVASHIHRPMLREVGLPGEAAPRWLLNTGAVGAPFDGDPAARYLLLDASDGRWVPSIRRVPYDRSGVLSRFGSSGLLAAGGLSAEIFRLEVLTARSLYTPFWFWTEAEGLPKDWPQWAVWAAAHPELLRPA